MLAVCDFPLRSPPVQQKMKSDLLERLCSFDDSQLMVISMERMGMVNAFSPVLLLPLPLVLLSSVLLSSVLLSSLF